MNKVSPTNTASLKYVLKQAGVMAGGCSTTLHDPTWYNFHHHWIGWSNGTIVCLKSGASWKTRKVVLHGVMCAMPICHLALGSKGGGKWSAWTCVSINHSTLSFYEAARRRLVYDIHRLPYKRSAAWSIIKSLRHYQLIPQWRIRDLPTHREKYLESFIKESR